MSRPTHARVDLATGLVVERGTFIESPPELSEATGSRWIPIVRGPEPQFDPDTQRVEVTVSVDLAAGTETVTSTVTPAPTMAPGARISATKLEARRRILARYPEWKQANLTARAVELVGSLAGGTPWTPADLAEVEALKIVWSWVRAVRSASDAIEVDPSITWPSQIVSDPRWPS